MLLSFFGCVFWVALLATWVVLFQLQRSDWGAAADRISMNIPKGQP